MASVARAIAKAMERDAVTTKYKKLCSIAMHSVGFAKKKMASPEEEVVKVRQELDTSVTKAE